MKRTSIQRRSHLTYIISIHLHNKVRTTVLISSEADAEVKVMLEICLPCDSINNLNAADFDLYDSKNYIRQILKGQGSY